MKTTRIFFLIVLFMIIGISGAYAASEAKIVASDAETGDYFGQSVAISGDYAIVGALDEDTNGADAGAAYIYHRTATNTWDAGVKIVGSDTAADDWFGNSVAISGDYAIVGAYMADAGSANSGAAYIFHRTDTNTWDAGTKIVSSDLQSGDYFGYSVGISGAYAIVGAEDQDSGGFNAGAAYIFHCTDTANNIWDAGVKIVASDPDISDWFGSAVAIAGDYAIVGAYGEDTGGSAAGAAYIYHRTDTNTWSAATKIVSSDLEAGDNFGYAVAISGDYAIVGAGYEDAAASDAGAAYIFHRTDTNTWDAGVKVLASDPAMWDEFGHSVGISGPYAIVSSPYNNNYGAAYLFNRTDTNTWSAGTKITASDAASGDSYGYSVAIYSAWGIVGANGEDPGDIDGAGSAYIVNHDLPAAVDLLAFEAEWTDAGAALSWLTGSETECGAFTILRCELGDLWNGCALDEYRELDLVIPCTDSLYGAGYEAQDATADPDVNYAYLLREYETTGGVNEYGPVFLNSLKYGNDQPDGEEEAPGDDDAAELPEDDAEASDDDESGESAAASEDAEEDDAGCGF